MDNIEVSNISSVGAEAMIVATLMYHPDFSLFSEHLKPHHFVQNDNSILYYAICELYRNNVTNVDIINLYRFISADPKLKEQFTMSVTNLDETRNYAEKLARHTVPEYNMLVKDVCDLAHRREMIGALQKGISFCNTDNFDKIALEKVIYNEISKVNNAFSARDEIPLFGDIVDTLWVQTLTKQSTNGYVGIPSKFEKLNDYCTYEQGELILISAQAKAGKSMFCMNELLHKLQLQRDEELAVLYIDTEMSDRLWNERLLAAATQIPTKKIKSGNYTPEEGKKIEDTIAWLKTKRFSHLYLPNWNKDILWEKAKQAQLAWGMNFFVFDYIKSQVGTDASSVYNELGNALNSIKNEIAGGLDIPCLCAAQLNRMGGIADSYKLEQYASTTITLKRKDDKQIAKDGKFCGNYKLFVKLNRLGEQMDDIETDYIDLNFLGDRATFSQAEKQHTVSNVQLTPFED
jgi:replicative DNA helicase